MAPLTAQTLRTLSKTNSVSTDELQESKKLDALHALAISSDFYMRQSASYGLPRSCVALRSFYWKTLLNLLPHDRSSTLALKRQYADSIQTLVHDSHHFRAVHDRVRALPASFESLIAELGVQSPQTQNLRTTYDLLDQIFKDVLRTQFSGTPASRFTPNTQLNIVEPNTFQDKFARILYIYAASHPLIKYVQGMNELLLPLFHVVMQDDLTSDLDEKEAEIYSMFATLMLSKGHYKLFSVAYDADKQGMLGRIEKVQKLLAAYDKQLYDHLVLDVGLNLQSFLLRWILLLFTQELDLDSGLLLVWDALIAEACTGDYDLDLHLVNFLCLSLLEVLRSKLLRANHSQCMDILQRSSSHLDLCAQSFVHRARAIRFKFIHRGKSIE